MSFLPADLATEGFSPASSKALQYNSRTMRRKRGAARHPDRRGAGTGSTGRGCPPRRVMNDRGGAVFTVDDAREYIAEVRWEFAKTMPQWPHEYTVRAWRPDRDGDFSAFVELIRSAGEVRPWPKDAERHRHHNTYLAIDGWQYWTMGAPVDETIIINRAHVDSPGAA